MLKYAERLLWTLVASILLLSLFLSVSVLGLRWAGVPRFQSATFAPRTRAIHLGVAAVLLMLVQRRRRHLRHPTLVHLDRSVASLVLLLDKVRPANAAPVESAIGGTIARQTLNNAMSSFEFVKGDVRIAVRFGNGRYELESLFARNSGPSLAHYGWLAVDVIHAPFERDRKDSFALIGPLMPKLGGTDTVALLSPQHPFGPLLKPWSAQLAESLQTTNPLELSENNNLSQGPTTSLVALSRTARSFEPAALEKALGAEFQRKLRQDDKGESFLLQKGKLFFAVHNCSAQYFGHGNKLPDSTDQRARQLLERHRAWYSVDLFDPRHELDERAALGLIGPALGALLGDGCEAIFIPGRSVIHYFTANTAAKLQSENPLDWMGDSNAEPVINVETDDAEMTAAIDEAKRRWPEFTAAFREGSAGVYCVKARFADGGHVEFMWLTVSSMDGGTVRGRVDNEPLTVKSVRRGSEVSVAVDDVVDWLYPEGGDLKGAFTQKVLAQR